MILRERQSGPLNQEYKLSTNILPLNFNLMSNIASIFLLCEIMMKVNPVDLEHFVNHHALYLHPNHLSPRRGNISFVAPITLE